MEMALVRRGLLGLTAFVLVCVVVPYWLVMSMQLQHAAEVEALQNRIAQLERAAKRNAPAAEEAQRKPESAAAAGPGQASWGKAAVAAAWPNVCSSGSRSQGRRR